jgi:hypothetical protein
MMRGLRQWYVSENRRRGAVVADAMRDGNRLAVLRRASDSALKDIVGRGMERIYRDPRPFSFVRKTKTPCRFGEALRYEAGG